MRINVQAKRRNGCGDDGGTTENTHTHTIIHFNTYGMSKSMMVYERVSVYIVRCRHSQCYINRVY